MREDLAAQHVDHQRAEERTGGALRVVEPQSAEFDLVLEIGDEEAENRLLPMAADKGVAVLVALATAACGARY